MKIGIDIDDTITYSFESVEKAIKDYIENDLKREYKYTFSEKEWYDLTEHYGLTKEEENFFIENYFTKAATNCLSQEESMEIINKLFDEKKEIIFITSRNDKWINNSEEVTRKWLEKNKFKYNKIIFNAKNKDEIARKEKIDIFIDDSIRHCKEVASKGIRTFLITRPFNKNYECKEFERVESWKEFYNKIKEMSNT